MTSVKYDSETTDRYTYEYDASGSAVLVRDNNLGRVLQTEHDLTDRPMGTQLRNADGSLIYRTELDYDKQNRLVGFGEEAEDGTYKTSYTYDNDNRVTEIGFGGSDKVKYTYDNLGRVSKRVVEGSATAGAVTSEYTFISGGHGTGSTTPLVARISQPKISFEYTYDNRGNIISEKRGTLTTTYAYDALGQLVRVNDPLEYATWVYEYDHGGNITSKKKYAYTTGTLGTVQQTIPYIYGDSTWKDKLTAYNGQAITYDAIGNPLSDGTWTYTWQAGRQLKKMTRSSMTVEFQYNHNGLRTQKKVTQNGVTTTTNYTLHGKLVTHLTVGSDKLHFFYDAQIRPAKVNFNGTVYTYLHNLQGDIVGIVDNSGNLVVEYKYDAWGKLLATTGTKASMLGKLNPFRYRGYVYDEETELYYLRSRYYHSAWRRFVNSDINLGIDIATFSHNIYAYCRNNPIIHADPTGYYVECLDGPILMVTGGPHGGGYPVCSPETTKKVRKVLDTTSKVVNAALIVGATATLIFVPAVAPIAKFVLTTSISAEISGRTNEKNGGHYYQGAGSAYVTSSIVGPNASVLKSFVTSSAIEMSSTYLNDRTTGGDEYAKIATKNFISSTGSGFIGDGVNTTTARELMSGMTDNFATVLEISFSLFADLSVKDLN